MIILLTADTGRSGVEGGRAPLSSGMAGKGEPEERTGMGSYGRRNSSAIGRNKTLDIPVQEKVK